MPYKKYYIYKEQVSVDMGETWDDTGNRAPSGDPIGEYATLAECEGKTPCYDGKCKVTYSDGHVYEVECNNSILVSGETKQWSRSDRPVNAVIGCCVTSIGEDAFRGYGLSSVIIPDSVTSIGNGAFAGCGFSSGVTIPDSVTSIGTWSFAGCGFSSIIVPDSVTNIGGGSFYGCSNLTSVTLPNSITTIKVQTFEKCENLTCITIPNSVLTIEPNAFDNCSGLTSVTVEATTPPSLGGSVFYNTNNCPIYVPAESLEAYKTASGWSTYASRIQAIT